MKEWRKAIVTPLKENLSGYVDTYQSRFQIKG